MAEPFREEGSAVGPHFRPPVFRNMEEAMVSSAPGKLLLLGPSKKACTQLSLTGPQK